MSPSDHEPACRRLASRVRLFGSRRGQLARASHQQTVVEPKLDITSRKIAARDALAFAQWWFDDVERRAEACRTKALSLLPILGATLAFALNPLDRAGPAEVILGGLACISAVATGSCALSVLFVRGYHSKVPIDSLRELVGKINDNVDRQDPNLQFLEFLTATMTRRKLIDECREKSASPKGLPQGRLEAAIVDLDTRLGWLRWGYILITLTFILVITQNAVAILGR